MDAPRMVYSMMPYLRLLTLMMPYLSLLTPHRNQVVNFLTRNGMSHGFFSENLANCFRRFSGDAHKMLTIFLWAWVHANAGRHMWPIHRRLPLLPQAPSRIHPSDTFITPPVPTPTARADPSPSTNQNKQFTDYCRKTKMLAIWKVYDFELSD